MPQVVETDVCLVGGGITSALLAEKLSEERRAAILVLEAGNEIFNLEERFERQQRFLDYGENPWPEDHIEDQTASGIQSRSMAVGGLALHWGGTCPRFTPEDFRLRSLYGIGDDWPLSYEEIEPYYQEAEERMGVAGSPGPPELDVRSRPYPMPALPLSYNLRLLRDWAEKSEIPFWPNPVAKNSRPYGGRNVCTRCDTCNICPTGAKYSPDFTYQKLLAEKRIELRARTLVRRLVAEGPGGRVTHALAVDRDRPDEPLEIRARVFVVAAGYVWSSHLLLLSASDRFPQGLANRSGMVGKYMTGHRPVNAFVEVPMKLYPGVYTADSLLSKRFQRPGPLPRYVRHDLRIWESTFARRPRLRDEEGGLLLGEELLEDWRNRCRTGTARLRAYYDVLPARESGLRLDPGRRNAWGDPLPAITMVDSEASLALRADTEEHIRDVFDRIVRAGGGTILDVQVDDVHDHPGGGCRMGNDPSTSVVSSYGRAHDHENLFVVGAPTLVSGGCANGTLTFVALALRSAEEIGKAFAVRQKERGGTIAEAPPPVEPGAVRK